MQAFCPNVFVALVDTAGHLECLSGIPWPCGRTNNSMYGIQMRKSIVVLKLSAHW
jgi:hypothetical protein